MACQHTHFEHEVRFKWVSAKELEVRQLVVILRLKCSKCGMKYKFPGAHGFSTDAPTTSDDGTELRVPVEALPEVTEFDQKLLPPAGKVSN